MQGPVPKQTNKHETRLLNECQAGKEHLEITQVEDYLERHLLNMGSIICLEGCGPGILYKFLLVYMWQWVH